MAKESAGEPLISVIIPVYNVEKYIDRCMETVLNQTYKNLEIILVDDGSTDSSGEKCDMYAQKDARVKVIHKENGGLSSARNAGIEIATGEYFSFIDSDDYISKHFIEILIETVQQENSEIVICCFKQGNKSDYEFPNMYTVEIETTVSANVGLKQWHDTHKKVETVAWNKLYSSSLFMDGIRYPNGKYFEDVATTHRLVRNAKQLTFIKNELYYYYQRNDSIQNTWSDKKISDKITMQEERTEWFRQHGYNEAYKRLLSKQMKYYMLCYVNANSSKMQLMLLEKFRETKKVRFECFLDTVIFEMFAYFHKSFRLAYRLYKASKR